MSLNRNRLFKSFKSSLILGALMALFISIVFSSGVFAWKFPTHDGMGDGEVGTMSPQPYSYSNSGYDTVFSAALSVNTFDLDLINRRENYIKIAYSENSSTKTFKIFNGLRNSAECWNSRHDNNVDTNPDCENIQVRYDVLRTDTGASCYSVPSGNLVYNNWSSLITIPQDACFSTNPDNLGMFSVVLKGYFYNPAKGNSDMPGNSSSSGSTGIKYFKGYQIDAYSSTGQVRVGFAGTTANGDLGYPMAIHNDVGKLAPGINPGWWNGNPDPQSSYHIDMTVGCDVPSNAPLRLRWEDADNFGASGSFSNDKHIRFTVKINGVQKFDTDSISNPNFLGGSQSTRYVEFDGDGIAEDIGDPNYNYNAPSIPVKPGDTIEWEWSGLRYTNNLTVSLFYDQIDPATVVDCKANVSDAVTQFLEPGETATFTRGITHPSGTTGLGSYYVDRTIYYPNGTSDTTHVISSASSHLYVLSGSTYVFSPGPDVNTNNTVDTTGLPIGTRICEVISASVPNGATTITDTLDPPVCTTIVSRPVVKFYGGDVKTCTAGSEVFAWAHGPPDYGSYSGSSVQYAIYASGAIDASNKNHGFYSRSEAGAGVSLTFASNNANPTLRNWGGSFGNSDCNSRTGGNTSDGNFSAGAVLNPGDKEYWYVDGDAYIGDDINYTGYDGSWTLAPNNNIPNFVLIVSGNIYINSSVRQLDGFYYASQNIYDCATSSGDKSFDYARCTESLTVHGSMYAGGSIKLWRTTPTLNTNGIAETFTLGPEMYLSNNAGITGPGSSSLQSLPPIF